MSTEPQAAPPRREQAAALRREKGWGSRRIAAELGISRATVRNWFLPRPPCPECGEPMSRQGQRCSACAAVARRKPAADRLDARLAASVTGSEAAEFADLVAAEGTTNSAELRAYVRRRIAGAGPGQVLDRGPEPVVTDLYAFVEESNRIEGITRPPLRSELEVHAALLDLDYLRPADVENFVNVVAGAPLRRDPGMDVWVGSHSPPPGGPQVVERFARLIEDVNDGAGSPWDLHVAYETLHPFMDGNGRSGRALWAWQMQHDGLDPFLRPFLHTAYYAALEGAHERSTGEPCANPHPTARRSK